MEDRNDETEARERVGTTVGGRWRFDALIGVGGMGAVYRATNVEVESEVALKVLLRKFAANDEVRRRFQAEGRIANKVQHPGVVKILDAGLTDDRCPYFVMEHLRGETLQARWEAHAYRLAPREAVEIAGKLLDVLAKAHEAGVVHRDIKPDNVFLTAAGELKVLDFGIARLHEAAPDVPRRRGKTRIGMPMGTAGFMAPEQATGQWDRVDARTDLWAVGATLFAVLAGETLDELPGGGMGPAPPIRTRLPMLDARVAAIVDRALAPDPAHRWPDASTMRDEIGKALAGLDEKSSAPTLIDTSRAEAEAAPLAAKTVPGAPLGAEARTEIGAPSAATLEREIPLPVVDGRVILPSRKPGPPDPPPGKRKPYLAALILIPILGLGAAGAAIVAIAGHHRTPGHETGQPEGGPPPVPLVEDVHASTSATPPVQPVETTTPAGPSYDGSACPEAEGVVWEKHCGKCVSLGTPETGCKLGTCKRCDLPNAVAACPKPSKPQRCIVGSCKPGFGDCDRNDDDGCEVDLRTSTASCGRCGNACPAADHAAPACSEGACKLVCDPGFADCDGRPGNGCEVKLDTSLAHCGACGHACRAAANQDTACREGACAVSCKPGWGDCNGDPADGCEVKLESSPAHCGACGNVCRAAANQDVACRGGACVASCRPGHADCNGDPADGCETDVSSDDHNCGGCRKACAPPKGGSVSCESGRCKPRCPAGATLKPDTGECVTPAPAPAESDPGVGKPVPPSGDAGSAVPPAQ
jgi:serine/threonine protein kinase